MGYIYFWQKGFYLTQTLDLVCKFIFAKTFFKVIFRYKLI